MAAHESGDVGVGRPFAFAADEEVLFVAETQHDQRRVALAVVCSGEHDGVVARGDEEFGKRNRHRVELAAKLGRGVAATGANVGQQHFVIFFPAARFRRSRTER